MPVEENLINKTWKRKKNHKILPFYLLKKKDAGENLNKKISKLKKIIKSNKIDYSLITASENIAWLLNIRGSDTEYSPLPHSHALVESNGRISLFCNLNQIKKIDIYTSHHTNFMKAQVKDILKIFNNESWNESILALYS